MILRPIILLLLILLIAACSTSSTDIRTLQRQHNVEGLVDIVNKSDDKELRLKAIEALGYSRDPRVISALSKALDSDSWVEREAAVKSLSYLNDYLSIKPIVKALDDDNRFVQRSADKAIMHIAETLGKKQDPRVLRQLILVIRETQSPARDSCINAFHTAVKELSRMQEPTFMQLLIAASGDDNKNVRQEGLRALGQFSDPKIVPPLIAALSDSSTDVRDTAIQSLEKITDPVIAAELLQGLENDNAEVREKIATILGKFNDTQIANKLVLSLSSQNPRVRAGAAKAMETILHPRALLQLVKMLSDNNAEARSAASSALKKYHWRPRSTKESAELCIAQQKWDECAKYKSAAIEPLITVLKGEDPELRHKAAILLTKLKWHPKDKSEKGHFCVAKKDWDSCVTLGKLAVPALVQELNSEDWQSRINAADALAKIGDSEAIDGLVHLQNDQNADVRIAGAEALKEFTDVQALHALIKALDDNNRFVRKTAEDVLNSSIVHYKDLNNPEVVQAFEIALKDNNRGVRKVAAHMLGELKNPSSAAALVQAMSDVDYEVRQAANESLLKINDNKAIDALVAGLKADNPEVRSEVVNVLSQYKNAKAIDPLLVSLKDVNYEVRISAIKALSETGDSRVVDPLLNALNDKQSTVRSAAAAALLKFDDPKIVPRLVDSLKDKDVQVRIESRKTLLEKNWQPQNKKEQGYYCVAKKDWIQCEEIGKDAIEPLLLEIGQNKSPLQIEAVRVLGEIKDPTTIKPIIDAIASTQWFNDNYKRNSLIETSTKALTKFGIQAIPMLKQTLTQWYTAQYTAPVLKKLKWKPRSNEDEIHYLIALRANSELHALWSETKRILMKDISTRDTEKMSNALYAFIGIGKEEVIAKLLFVLDNWGTIQIAEAYLNSGNQKLINGAVNWSKEHGLEVQKYSDGNSPVQWGRL